MIFINNKLLLLQTMRKALLIFILFLFTFSFSSQAQSTQSVEKNRNVISFHITDLLYTDFLLSYEHKFPEKEYGLYFPFAYNFGKGDNLYGLNSKYFTGFGLHYYFKDDIPVYFFMGPEANFGMAKVEYFDFNSNDNLTQIETYSEDFFYSRVFYNGGFRYSPQRNTSLLVKLGFGVQYADYPNIPFVFETAEGKFIKDYNYYQEKRITPVFNFSFGLGISF